jgi:hypothetical protein
MAFGADSNMQDAEQEKILEETLRGIVKPQAFEMKRCLDRKEVMEAIRYANIMLSELRLTTLNPKFYYRLCKQLLKFRKNVAFQILTSQMSYSIFFHFLRTNI